MTTRLLQWHGLQQLECTRWFLLHDVFTGELQPGSGHSIWRVSLTRPTQPLQAGGITCLPSTDCGRWRDHYAGLGGKARAVVREYINMCENTLNALNLGLGFATGKFTEVFPRIGIGIGSVLPSEVELAAFLMHVLWHTRFWAQSLRTSFPPSALNNGEVSLGCSEIHAPRHSTVIFAFVYKRYNTYFLCAQDREAISDKMFPNNHPQHKIGFFWFIVLLSIVLWSKSRNRLCLSSAEVS